MIFTGCIKSLFKFHFYDHDENININITSAV